MQLADALEKPKEEGFVKQIEIPQANMMPWIETDAKDEMAAQGPKVRAVEIERSLLEFMLKKLSLAHYSHNIMGDNLWLLKLRK